jgi:O-antigen ligase
VPAPRHFLVFYLAAILAAFGGIYPWALLPIVIGAAILAMSAFRVPSRPSPDTWALDIAIVALVGAVALQLIPLPPSVRDLVSPALTRVETMLRPDAGLEVRGAAPLSIDPRATVQSIALLLAVALTYFAARRIFSRGGVGFTCAALSLVGATAAVAALVQRALTPRLIYGFWQPNDSGALPFGPVVNRNHFAAWLVMVSALAAGYLVDRGFRRIDARGWAGVRQALVRSAQSSAPWTALLWLTMVVTIVASQSRSALVGLAVGGAGFMRALTRGWTPTIVAFGVLAALALSLLAGGASTVERLADRFAGTLNANEIDRSVIWRETIPMVQDFALTGVGAGSFQHAILVYQQTRVFVPHLGTEWHFNHAHNHYLQGLAEGGLLLLVPAAVVLMLFVRLAWRRMHDGDEEVRGMRLAAMAGLVGVAVQSLWEVPLTMPAAALLAATLAAMATCRRSGDR